LAGVGMIGTSVFFRHCEERSDEAIQFFSSSWIAPLRSQ
jgi:hypothetical protein